MLCLFVGFRLGNQSLKIRKKVMRILLAKRGDVKKIAELFKVSPRTVYNALYYKVGGKQAEEIRFWALQNGGIRLP